MFILTCEKPKMNIMFKSIYEVGGKREIEQFLTCELIFYALK